MTMDEVKREIVGIPCVGGKTKLAKFLCETIERVCAENGISTYISACGGGGKDILSLHHSLFDTLIYNEYEAGLADLMHALTKPANVDVISKGVHDLIEKVLAMPVEIESKAAGDDTSDVIKELKLRAMFEFLLEAQKENDKAAHGDSSAKRLDIITSAVYETILVYGSVQSNRKGIFYRSADGKRDFYEDIYIKEKYKKKIRTVAERAQDIATLNGDCIELVKKHKDREDVFIYIDPPYWNCTNDYKNTFDFDDHIRLIQACVESKSKIMISMHEFGVGPYYVGLYDQDNWKVYETPVIAHVTRGSNGITFNKMCRLVKYGLEKLPIMQANASEIAKIEDNTSVNEYVFCNFEIKSNDFHEITVDEDGKIIGHENPENDGFDIVYVLQNAVYTLYNEKKQYFDSDEVYEKTLESILKATSDEDFQKLFEGIEVGEDSFNLKQKCIDKIKEIVSMHDKEIDYSPVVKKKARELVKKFNNPELKNNNLKRTKSNVKKIYASEYDDILNKIKNIL